MKRMRRCATLRVTGDAYGDETVLPYRCGVADNSKRFFGLLSKFKKKLVVGSITDTFIVIGTSLLTLDPADSENSCYQLEKLMIFLSKSFDT